MSGATVLLLFRSLGASGTVSAGPGINRNLSGRSTNAIISGRATNAVISGRSTNRNLPKR